MPVCVECGQGVDRLYQEYGKGNVCLVQCNNCGKFADKYLEFDRVIIFIDMVLHKPQAYRHLLLNRLNPPTLRGNNDNKNRISSLFNGGNVTMDIIKLMLLLVMFAVYVKWSRMESIELQNQVIPTAWDFVSQYVRLLAFCIIEFILFLLGIQMACATFLGWKAASSKLDSIVAGLVLSSLGIVLHLIMNIWEYQDKELFFLIDLMVFSSNIEMLSVIFNISYPKSFIILCCAVLSKVTFQQAIRFIDPKFPLTLF